MVPSADIPSDPPSDNLDGTVTLTFPADTVHVALARTVTATMAARADLPLDQLEDARLAVDEAVSQLIADAKPGTDVRCAFDVSGTTLVITVSASSRSGRPLAHDTFSWTVLTALADVVESRPGDDQVAVRLTISRVVPVDA